jgi:hypothetical protein
MTKKEEIIEAVKEIIEEIDMKMSLRQIYYQLVAKAIIPNNISQYKQLSHILVDARKNGEIEYDSIEDRTRSFKVNYDQKFYDITAMAKWLVDYVKKSDYLLPPMLFQPKLHLIVLEKQALEAFFEDAIKKKSNTLLIINRGYNSLTQLHECAESITNLSHIKEIHISYFGDWDPSGKDIERNFEEQLTEQIEEFDNDFEGFTSFNRIGIIPQQITKFNLPTAIAKEKDARSQSWQDGGCVELDALPPTYLRQIINDQVNLHYDTSISDEVRQLNVRLNNRYKKLFFRKLQDMMDNYWTTHSREDGINNETV